LQAAEALKAIAMLPKLPAFDAALFAIHEYSLHEAVAVCQANNQDGGGEFVSKSNHPRRAFAMRGCNFDQARLSGIDFHSYTWLDRMSSAK
jgi:hypothetical protein